MSKELLTTDWYKNSGSGTFTTSNDGLKIETTNATWIYTREYISLPVGNGITYEYDFDVSVTANNQVYIQIERFNADKGTISNNAATNCIGGYKPTTDVSHVRYKGTIALATFGNDPIQNTAFIRVRACGGYSNTSGTFIIHSWSLRTITNGTRQTASINKQGQMITDYYRENFLNASFDKDGFIEGQQLYEY